MAAINELEKQREEMAARLAEIKRVKEDQDAQGQAFGQMEAAVEDMQKTIRAQQQTIAALGREQRESSLGTESEARCYLVKDYSGVSASDRDAYLKTDNGMVRLKGHFVEHPHGGEILRWWEWGLLDDPQPKTAAQLYAQKMLTLRNFCRGHVKKQFGPRLDVMLHRALSALDGSVAKIFADSAGIGAEWIPDRMIPELEREVMVPTNLTGLYKRRTISPGGTLKLPFQSGRLRVYKGAVPTIDNPADALLSSLTTTERSIDTVPMVIASQVERDAVADSLIDSADILMTMMIEAFRYADDDCIINGDTTATHQDTIATWDGRGELGGTTGLGTTADHRRCWDGLRRRAFALEALHSAGTTDQNGAQTWDGLRAAVALLGVKNLMRGHVVQNDIVVMPSWEYFFSKMVDFDEFDAWDNVGAFASVLTGKLGDVGGTPGGMLPGQVGYLLGMLPVVVPFPLTGDLASTGKYTGSGSTTGMIQHDRSRFEYVVRQGMSLESDVEIRNNTVVYVARKRTTFRAKDPAAATIKDTHFSINLTY